MAIGPGNQRLHVDNRSLSIIVFATFFAWMLSFPFEGQVLYAIADRYAFDPRALIFEAIAAHLVGLFGCGFFIKTMRAAKNLMLYSIVFCIASSTLFFFAPSAAWQLLLPASLLAGACVAAWGFFFRSCTPPKERLHTAAEGLIYSNILMIVVNMMAIHLLPEVGLAASILLLIFAFFFALSLPEQPQPDGVSPGIVSVTATQTKIVRQASLGKPLGLLCLFVAVITVDSGLMYQVINPAFSHLQWLVSWYWAVPYIVALQIMKRLPQSSNRAHILYIAIAMIGFAFIFFMILDRSVASYLLVNALMLGACGVFDLFWWSILGEMLDLADNPARVLGVGLAANVLGVLLGGMLGSQITAPGRQPFDPALLALGIVLLTLTILPLLNQRLSLLLKNHAFLSVLSAMSVMEQTSAIDGLALLGDLTEREKQIADLLQRGRTYKMIADELYLSENTVKTHIKSVYSKLNVQSKAELVRMIIQHDRALPR